MELIIYKIVFQCVDVNSNNIIYGIRYNKIKWSGDLHK